MIIDALSTYMQIHLRQLHLNAPETIARNSRIGNLKTLSLNMRREGSQFSGKIV